MKMHMGSRHKHSALVVNENAHGLNFEIIQTCVINEDKVGRGVRKEKKKE
jgi:hypothetical protein